MKPIKDIMVHGDYVAFWGGVFSNFYPCEIHVEDDWWGNPVDLHFKSSEQYFMWLKAEYFEDHKTAKEILKAEKPEEAKKLGRKVKDFDEKEWSGVREAAMWNAVYAKFSQNQNLREIITDDQFKGKSFVEGSPFDGIWGVKLDWRDERIADPDNWQGLNLLGKTLDTVRRELL